uniref:Uncharacterized protein n=1 Tax=Romanomermis culicivorax TaxID=13658 RepID=A0A915I193_ROMCU
MISHLQKLKEVHVENFQIGNFHPLSYCITIRVSGFFERKTFIKCEENTGAHTNNIEKLMNILNNQHYILTNNRAINTSVVGHGSSIIEEAPKVQPERAVARSACSFNSTICAAILRLSMSNHFIFLPCSFMTSSTFSSIICSVKTPSCDAKTDDNSIVVDHLMTFNKASASSTKSNKLQKDNISTSNFFRPKSNFYSRKLYPLLEFAAQSKTLWIEETPSRPKGFTSPPDSLRLTLANMVLPVPGGPQNITLRYRPLFRLVFLVVMAISRSRASN